jgi:quinolinate synthase
MQSLLPVSLKVCSHNTAHLVAHVTQDRRAAIVLPDRNLASLCQQRNDYLPLRLILICRTTE